MKSTRRQILGGSAAAVTLSRLSRNANANDGESESPRHIATNTYPWLTFARRKNQELTLHTDQLLGEIASTGITGYEPIINDAKEFEGLAERLAEHGLEMRSIYVNSTLHDANVTNRNIEEVLAIAQAARALGAKIVVTNPSPIRWGGPENKNDAQLRLQAKSLDRLGAQLRHAGTTLAYHNHDAELREGGREFHHMLTATDPANVKLCLDAHWIYRGCGNSEVAVFDAVANYGRRIVELHLRQSNGGDWTEAFSMAGDIDYARLFGVVGQLGLNPHLVLEQSVEDATPNRLTAVEAHRRSNKNLVDAVA